MRPANLSKAFTVIVASACVRYLHPWLRPRRCKRATGARRAGRPARQWSRADANTLPGVGRRVDAGTPVGHDAGDLRTDERADNGGYGAGEQHPDTRPEVLVRGTEQRAADRRTADEDKQVQAHHPAPDPVVRRGL
jgi:hypothetical protein